MVRVHVRPPFHCRPSGGRRVVFGKRRRTERRDRPHCGRGFPPLPPREKLNSHSGAGTIGPRPKSRFFVKKRSIAPPRGVRGRHDGPAWRRFWRPGCTGARRMPWRRQAMKDAASCEKPRGGACGPRSGDVRMGQPAPREGGAPARIHMAAGARPGEVKHLSSRRKGKQQ